MQPDIVHLHWVGDGLIRLEKLRNLRCPIVWTLHDMWPLTGGCHYSGGCDRYLTGCGHCPALKSSATNDLSARVFARKRKTWPQLDLTLISPSNWLADLASRSPLLQNHNICVIPNGLDLSVYRPVDKTLARNLFGLPENAALILFGGELGSRDLRKGADFLFEAIKILTRREHNFEVAVFGYGAPEVSEIHGFRVHNIGPLHDDVSLALLYAAADVFVAPSREDNLPNTVMEAMACGTPCVAFSVGGLPDLIRHQTDGYLAVPFDAGDLAHGIDWVASRCQELGSAARASAEARFSIEAQSAAYHDLYRDILENQGFSKIMN